MDTFEAPSPMINTKFASAVQITRPKSASKQGPSLHGSPINLTKVAKLVLKPAPISISNKALLPANKPSSPQKREASGTLDRFQTSFDNLRLNQTNPRKISSEADSRHEPIVKKYQQTVELEIQKAEREKKALKDTQRGIATTESTSHNHKSSTMDEVARKEAREFMKKQREKRKLEKEKDVDKSVDVIKQRLDELRKTTKTVITKKNKSQTKFSATRDLYSSTGNLHMREIRVLKLKPMSAKSQTALDVTIVATPNDSTLKDMIECEVSPVKSDWEEPKSPAKITSHIHKPSSPQFKKPPSPLQTQNHQLSLKPGTAQQSARPSSSKENKKPHDDLKLKVPDLKLSMSNVNRNEMLPRTFAQSKVPFWLQNTAVQPYPYNFIWAVRKKLEAYTSAEEKKQKAKEKFNTRMNLETPHMKNTKVRRGNNFPDRLSKYAGDDTGQELQRPTMNDESQTQTTSMEREMASEANTISEISSIQSDMVMVKSKSLEKVQQKAVDDDDDTTISESIFHSLKDDVFVGRKRESVNSEFSRSSFPEKVEDLLPENVSPNTTDKRNIFLSSTMLPSSVPAKKIAAGDQKVEQNDLGNNKVDREKEEDYQKMLTAFNQSLSHVIEVNQMLSTVLSSKSSIASSTKTSGTVKNYSSSFENNLESEVRRASGDSNISEMIENIVQHAHPGVQAVDQRSEANSSIKTFIEDSKSTTLKPDVYDAIEDPPIVFNELAQEFSSSSTKVTTTTTTKIVQQKLSIEKKEEVENTLNESKLLNMFRHSESETSFNIADNNKSFGMLMDKSSSEIKSWERTLTERTRGQIAWLELQKQNFRKHGQVEKVSTIKKQQRAILLRLEREKSKLKENSERALVKASKNVEKKLVNLELSEGIANDSFDRDNIQRVLEQREQKLAKRRAQVENLIKWQKKLDKEEDKLKQMEQDLLGDTMKNLSTTPRKKKSSGDVLNTSIEMVKSIDKSLKVLESIESSADEETVEMSGVKLNKLWHRLTGFDEKLYQPLEIYHLNKRDVAQFYEEAKEVVLQSDLKMLLETSMLPQQVESRANEKIIEAEKRGDDSDVSTMNSIANIETEEEFPGSHQMESKTVTSTDNDEELQDLMANQMRVFLDVKKPLLIEDAQITNVSECMITPTIDNTTFKVNSATTIQDNIQEDLDESASSIGTSEMDIERDSLIQTEPLISIENSSVDAEGFIIPEANSIQVTDMDQDDDSLGQLIEDISFPNLEISMSDEPSQQVDDNNRNDLSTITECTEYEASQGSSNDEISSEIVSYASTATTSERVNSEVEKRLISINDSLEEVNDAFKNVAIIHQSPSTVTYSTDKDFAFSEKASSSESNENSISQNVLIRLASDSESTTIKSGSQITTSTPKVITEIDVEVSSSKHDDDSNEF